MSYFTISLTKQKKDIYRELMLKYGVITILYVMQEHEQNENYAECAIIKEAIDECNVLIANLESNKCHVEPLPTTLQGLNVRHFLDSAYHAYSEMKYNGTFSADAFFVNLDFYIEQVKVEIDNLSK